MGHDHAHFAGVDVHGTHVPHPSPRQTGRALAVGIALNGGFVVLELGAGVATGAMSLLADAAHNLSDVLGLMLAWGAMVLARRAPTALRTYGLGRTTILAALANALLIMVGVGGVSWEAVRRLQTGAHPPGLVVAGVALAGVVVNLGSALLLSRGRKTDANVRAAYLHLMADAAVSAGVVFAGAMMMVTDAPWLDPVASLVVSAVVVVATVSMLKDATNLALDAVPKGIDAEAVRAYLEALPGVTEIHDLHIWALSTTETALTVHLVMDVAPSGSAFLRDVRKGLAERHHIGHSTIQIESPREEDAPCSRADPGVH